MNFSGSLISRGVIAIEGHEAGDFLQGLVTNDVAYLQEGQACYTCLLTAQGKYLFDFFVIKSSSGLLLECEGGERLQALLRLLKLYVLRRPLDISDQSQHWSVVVSGGGMSSSSWAYGYPDPRSPALGYRGLVKGRGEVPSGEEAYAAQRLTLVIPEGMRDLEPQKSIILECGFDTLQAMSWTKGCYMGQELMARTKHRGLVRKRLFGIEGEGGDLPPPHTVIYVEDTELGRVTSTYGVRGFALLRLEVLFSFKKGDQLPRVHFEGGQEARIWAPADL